MSNRLTFSLASLIFLITLGLVFVPASVMAHEARSEVFDLHHDGKGSAADTAGTDTTTNLTGSALTTETGHRHGAAPTVTRIELVDVKIGADKAARDKADAKSTVDGASVMLVDDAAGAADDAAITAITDFGDTAATAGEFRIKITFSHDVYVVAAEEDDFGALLDAADLAADLLPATAITDVAASKAATGVRIDALTIAEVARMAKSSKVFLATVTVPATSLSNVPMDVWIGVNANAVVTKGQFSAGQNTHGRGNAATTAATMFSIVKEFEDPDDTTAPTVAITIADDLDGGKVVFTLTFSEPLAKTGLNKLTLADIDIDGGEAMAADLSAGTADGDKEAYTLKVTPDEADASVTISLMANAVTDVDGNVLVAPATDGSTMATYDVTPPTVMITPPDEPDEDGNLTFTFDFSEEVQPATITLDRSGSDNVRLGENSDPMVDDDDNTIYTILVEPRNPDVDTTVLLLKGSVMDMAGNGLAADAEATYRGDNTAPVFEDPAPTVPALCEDETISMPGIKMSRARDADGDDLDYDLLIGGVPVPENNTDNPPAKGLYWVTVENEERYIRGTATLDDAGTYTWTVKDQHENTTENPHTFTITVEEYQEPEEVIPVSAMKVDAEATAGDDVDKVKLTWTNPNPTVYPNDDCIPVVTSYIVNRQALNSHSLGRTTKGDPEVIRVAIEDLTTETNAAGMVEYTYITERLGHGTYVFTVIAVNSRMRHYSKPVDGQIPDPTTFEGQSDPNMDTNEAEDKFDWVGVTDYHWIIVNDPPVWDRQRNPANLRVNQLNPDNSVTLDWRPPATDPGALVDDTEAGLAMALYGVDKNFGGYHLEITNQATDEITIYPEAYDADPDKDPENLIRGNQRTFNIAFGNLVTGEYTARVVSHNIAGKSLLSQNRDFEVDVSTGPSPAGKAPSFGPYTIADIEVEVGDRIGMTLGAATDPEGNALSYSLRQSDGSALPEGLNFDASARRLSASAATAAMEGEYTYTAFETGNLNSNAKLTFFIEVMDPTVPPTGRGTVVTSIPANGFIVYVRDLNNPPHFGTSSPMVAEWSDMPNLYEFFTQGGGGSLQLNVTDATARQVVFNEVMWAVDLGKVGQDSYDGNQWIELRNRTDSAIPTSSISFMTKQGRPALAEGTDLISNVVGGGSAWIRTKGQNGNSGAADGSGQVAFVSMRRSNYGVGWNGGHWTAATRVYHPNNKGTPGADEPQGVKTFPASGVAINTIFNEIGNYPSGKFGSRVD